MSGPIPNDAFEDMFEANDDPWAFRTRWYEERKRQLTLASLPSRRFSRGYEPGCANGELSAALATRCDHLLVSDVAPRAVELARERLAKLPHVVVIQSAAPAEWPPGPLDLVVVSELGYYLSETMLALLASNARDSLSESGVLLACHWRRPVEGCELSGEDVHRLLGEGHGMHLLAHHVEDDFVMDVWSRNVRSVAQREGFA